MTVVLCFHLTKSVSKHNKCVKHILCTKTFFYWMSRSTESVSSLKTCSLKTCSHLRKSYTLDRILFAPILRTESWAIWIILSSIISITNKTILNFLVISAYLCTSWCECKHFYLAVNNKDRHSDLDLNIISHHTGKDKGWVAWKCLCLWSEHVPVKTYIPHHRFQKHLYIHWII